MSCSAKARPGSPQAPARSAPRRSTRAKRPSWPRRFRSRGSTRSRRSSRRPAPTPCSSARPCSPRTSRPGLAARLDAGLNWDLTDLSVTDGELVGKRPALGDTVVVDVGWNGGPKLALVRAGSFDPVESGGTAEVEAFETTFSDFSTLAALIGQTAEASSGPSIEDADIIVAGGRGLGSPEGFTLLEELAAALGGAVGATRAVVDAGWYPYSTQVGQTGKSVSPKLYIACGISGAIQHKVGMQGSGTIVAINKDPNAPIFDFCDIGVVGDLHQIVPKLTELVRSRG